MNKINDETIKEIKKRKEELLKLGIPADLIPVIIFMEFMK